MTRIWKHAECEFDETLSIAKLREKVKNDRAKFFEHLQHWEILGDDRVLRCKVLTYDVDLDAIADRKQYLE